MEPTSDKDRRRLPRPRGRARIAAALALLVVIAVILIVVLDSGSPSTPSSSANAADVTGAATVQRRDLVETDTESGTLSYADPQTVYNRLSGTITSLPNVGQLIRPGGTLFRVNGEPVILMNGSTPAFRALGPSDTAGADVLQLNRNLVALGFNPDGIVVDDVWQAATTAGVDLFQASLGEAETGILELGQVVFMPGAQLISAVDGTLGSTGGGGGSSASNPSSSVSASVDPPAPEFVSLQTSDCPAGSGSTSTTTTTNCPSTKKSTGPHHTSKDAKKHHSSKQPSSLAALVGVLRSETQALEAQLRAAQQSAHSKPKSSKPKSSKPSSSSNNPSSSNSDGGGGGTPVAILQTTSTKLVVTVDLSASSQSEAVVGEHVTVEMPSGNTVDAKITAVSPVAQSSSNSGNNGGSGSGGGGSGSGNGNGGSSSSTVPVTVTLKGHHTGAGLDQAAVSVNFAQQRANHVLSVPVTALVAVAGGRYAIQEAQAPQKLIPVTPGLFAAGYVQISGSGVYQGLQVTDSQG